MKTEGLSEFRKQAESAKQYFTKRKQTTKFWDFSELMVTIGIDYLGVLAIDLPNGIKAGETLELKGISEFKFENEKIKSIIKNAKSRTQQDV